MSFGPLTLVSQMKSQKEGLIGLKEEWDSFLASEGENLDLSTSTLPKAPNVIPLDSNEQNVINYQEFWRIKPEVHLCPIVNKIQQIAQENLKEKWIIQIERDKFPLFPGDSFGIYPPNSQETLQNLSQSFPLEKLSAHLLDHVRFRADFASFPKKSHMRYLGDFSKEEKQRKFLYFLSSTAGSSAYARLRQKFVRFEDIFRFFQFNCFFRATFTHCSTSSTTLLFAGQLHAKSIQLQSA